MNGLHVGGPAIRAWSGWLVWGVFGLAVSSGCEPGAIDPEALGEAIESTGGTCDADGDGVRAMKCGGGDCDDRAPGVRPGAAETCNGQDDDCDGRPDEGLGLGEPCAAFTGACAGRGVRVCGAGGSVICDASPGAPGPEACNGVDDDCDGITDEGFDLGAPCEVGVGACHAAGVIVCGDGAARCDAAPGEPGVETCDGTDDDCDGATDEGFDLGAPCEVGVGACHAAGVLVCGDGAARCGAAPGAPAAETCDGTDDDCDGATDEGFDLGAPCAVGVGACHAAGVVICGDGAARCDAAPGEPGAEICDGIDDDCDGATDEGFDLGAPCAVGVGACHAAGVVVCGGGAARCDAAPGEPGAEICDGIDDDCDGVTDEGFDLGASCDSGVGACRRTGRRVCADGGGAACDARAGAPGVELCDGIDGDCDGAVDEGLGRGLSCSRGVGACRSEGVFICAADGGVSCDARALPPGEELCDGIDGDCDGAVDEGLDLGAPCTAGFGACAAEGVRACGPDGRPRCDAEPGLPEPERCDDLDNDCDTLVDEVFAFALGAPCAVGDGACRAEGAQVCGADGALVCDAPVIAPVEDVCDGLDNDCDGGVDEGIDLDVDPAHCGACGRACPEVAFGTDACDGGRCRRACAGDGDCLHEQLCDVVGGRCVVMTPHLAVPAPAPYRLRSFGYELGLSDGLLVVGDERIEGVDGAPTGGGVWVFERRDGWSRSTRLAPRGAGRNDRVGANVAATDDLVLAGATGEAGDASSTLDAINDDAPGAGAVHVFAVGPDGSWSQVQYLKAPEADPNDQFGDALAVVGDTLFVGAPGHDGAPDSTLDARVNGDDRLGVVYVFRRQADGGWRAVDLIRADAPVRRSAFGQTLSAAPGRLAVGGAETVWVFEQDPNGRWVEAAQLERPPVEAATLDAPLAIAGDVLVIGDPDADTPLPGSGAARVYARDPDGGWGLDAVITPDDPGVRDGFGVAVAATPSRIFVGARFEDGGPRVANGWPDDSTEDAGAVYAFERRPEGWAQTRYIKAPVPFSGEEFGSGLAVAGSTLAVGAPNAPVPQEGESAGERGVVHVFDLSAPFDGAICAGGGEPGAETCDGFDGDCDGLVDEGYDTRAELSHCGACGAVCGAADPARDVCVHGSCRAVCAPGLPCPPDTYCGSGPTAGYCPLLHGAYLKQPFVGAAFGRALAISGDSLAVGASDDGNADSTLAEPNTLANAAGAVFVYDRAPDGGWVLGSYLKAFNAARGAYFGWAVAMDGDLLVAGAPNENGSAESTLEAPDSRASSAGAAYVFERQPGGGWSQVAYLKASNAQSYDAFGSAVAVHDGVVVVGAPAEDGGSGSTVEAPDEARSNAGAAYVFERDADGVWVQTAYLKARFASGSDRFGSAVAVYDGAVAVAAPDDDLRAGSTLEGSAGYAGDAGGVYVYRRGPDGAFAAEAYLKASNAESYDHFGASLAMHGTWLVVGAPEEDGGPLSTAEQPDNRASRAGAVYAFARGDDGAWEQMAYLKVDEPGPDDHFGDSVDVFEDTVIVGSPDEDGSAASTLEAPDDAGDRTGAAYVFVHDEAGWTLRRYLKADAPDTLDHFGAAVAVGAAGLAAGAPDEDGDSSSTVERPNDHGFNNGAVYTFEH